MRVLGSGMPEPQGGSARMVLLALLLVAQAGLRQVTRVSQDEPVYSPDGTRILFISEIDGPNNIYVMNAEGRHIVRLTNYALSNDGQRKDGRALYSALASP